MLNVGGKKIAISGDIRLSTPELINFLKRVLFTGVDIINLNVPTPVNYFAMFHLDLSASVQVTGSTIRQNLMGLNVTIKNHFLVKIYKVYTNDDPYGL